MEQVQEFITNEAEVGLPPLQSSRKAVWKYYRIEFLPSGYPGRRTGDTLFAHPIYGPYVIADYVAQYRRTQDPVFLNAACKVADAAIEQMTPIADGLAFMYDQESTAVSMKGGVWYSGLTQSRYIEVFNKLLSLPGTERYREPLSHIIASLQVPVQDGGVALETANDGLMIEEYPSIAPDATLNGWTTATCILRDYASSNKDEQAWELFRRSVRGLESVISIYDAPEYANSRYRLKGPASFKVTATGADVEIYDCKVVWPGYGTFDANVNLDPVGSALQRGPVSIGKDQSQLLTLELSRLTWPAPNRVKFAVRASGEGSVSVSIGDGIYNPLAKSLVPQFYRPLGDVPVLEGDNVVEVEVPWTEAEIVAYPTNFAKGIAGQQFNQYHWIHVDTLTKIVNETGSDILRYYRDRWARFPERWKDIPEYQDERITLERFDAKKHK